MVHPKPKKRKPTGKELGLSLGQCLLRGKVYSREMRGPAPFLYLLPLLAGWLLLDIVLRCHYADVGTVGFDYAPAWLFTIGWSILMVGLVLAVPRGFKYFFRCVPLMFCMACMETHSGFYNYFGNFFSLSVLSFVGNGGYADSSYIKIDGVILAGAISTILLMMFSGHLLKVMPQRVTKGTVGAGLILMLVGFGFLVGTSDTYYPPVDDTVIYKTETQTKKEEKENHLNNLYHEFSDKNNCLMLSGLYQYTARDIWALINPATNLSSHQEKEIETYIQDYEAAEVPNRYTGLLAGKNVIMVQLEAIDTWMLSESYMPNLYRLKSEGISFANHYAPAYITAGTFNTEFMVHTSLLPATGNTPTSVYTDDSYPYALANLFTQKGYTARSFHSSDGTVYDRGTIHLNFGYESYTSGEDMEMAYTQMDRYLMNGFEAMTEGDPFFSFVITVSAHGAYSDETATYQAHAAEAQAVAERTDGNYVYAVAGAMETDEFIGELLEGLEQSGHLDDTALIFYADHYNYYMVDDGLQMEIKGVSNMNMLQHTDFFIWSADMTEPVVVDKVTYTPDVLPTLANLFDLDTEGAFLIGHDGLGDGGGYVFFADGSWYDGTTYWNSTTDEGYAERTAEINRLIKLNGLVLRSDYYRDVSKSD